MNMVITVNLDVADINRAIMEYAKRELGDLEIVAGSASFEIRMQSEDRPGGSLSKPVLKGASIKAKAK